MDFEKYIKIIRKDLKLKEKCDISTILTKLTQSLQLMMKQLEASL